jgi:hypothetical protein
MTLADGVTASIGVQDDNPTTDSFNFKFGSSDTTLDFSRTPPFTTSTSQPQPILARSPLIVEQP